MSKRSAKTKAQLVAELEALRQRVAGLEASQAGYQQAEIALCESEKQRHLVVDTLHEGIWIIDANSYITFANPRIAAMLGYTAEEMIGKRLFSFMDEQHVAICKGHLERRRQGIKEQHDFEFLRKDGTRICTLLKVAPIMDDARNYAGAMAGVVDITGRKRMEDALEESERRFRLLAECLPGLVYIFDLTTRRTIYMNRQSFLGYTWDDLTDPTSITANLHPDDRSLTMEHWQQLAKGESDDPHGVAYRVLDKSGQWEWVRQHITVMTWEDQGKPACILVTLTLETKREHAAKMVRESEERYRHITEALTDYIYRVRVEGGRVVETTHGQACVAVTGYTSEDFAANPDLWLQMVDERDRQAVLEQAHRLLAGQDVQPLEHRITRKDGVRRWVRNTPVPYLA